MQISQWKLQCSVYLFRPFVFWFMCKFLEYNPKWDLLILKNFFRIIQYIIVLATEIVKSSFAVIKIVYGKSMDIQPQIVFFDVPIKK